ncbi:MAG: endonuclease, partial [Myxococcales bacterium]
SDLVAELRDNLLHRADEVVTTMNRRMQALAATERFEDASSVRDRLATFVRAATRRQRLGALTACAEIVAARRDDGVGWTVHVIRHGRLTASGVIPPGVHAPTWVEQLRASAESVIPGLGPLPAASAEECAKVLRWLESPGIRLIHVDGDWTCPVRGAARHLATHDAIEESRRALVPFKERRLPSRVPS